MTVDPFSEILRLANAQSVVSGGFTAGGSWAIRFPAFDKLKFSAMIRGNCWLVRDGDQEPVRIEAGDVFLLSAQRTFVLASDLAAVPIEAASVFSRDVSEIVNLGGEECLQIGGFVRLDPASGGLLADVLPPLIHVRAASPHAAALHWLLDQLVHERAAELPGASLASAQLAQLIFIQIIRAHLQASGDFAAGWLRALGDKRIAPALRLMHGDPARSWQLEELAKASAMSRTTFVVRFKNVAGVPPLTYLLNWRMRLAERTLRTENVPVSALALSLGYTSESAFSNAFKRTIGIAPKRYRDSTTQFLTGVSNSSSLTRYSISVRTRSNDPERDLGSILCRIELDAQRALAERRVKDVNDRFRNLTPHRHPVERWRQRLLGFSSHSLCRSRLVLRGASLVVGRARMRGVVGAAGALFLARCEEAILFSYGRRAGT